MTWQTEAGIHSAGLRTEFLRVVTWALGMVPYLLLTVSNVWARNLYRGYTGYVRGALLRSHTVGP